MRRRRRPNEERIFFPWESRGGFRRWLGVSRLRPFLVAFCVVGFVAWIGVRERRRSGIRQTRATLLNARQAVDAYMADHDGGCPPTLAAVDPYGHFKAPPRDAWGHSLRLICPAKFGGAAYELMSDGPDGKPGGLDRIE